MNLTSYPRFFLLINFIRDRSTPEPPQQYLEGIKFHYFNELAEVSYTYNLNEPINENHFSLCDKDDDYAIVTHGYKQDCREEYIIKLVKNLIKYRGGCILCMDYSNFAYQNYAKLVRNFKPIPQVMTKQLFLMEQLGFDPDRAYLFGFSLGAHIMARGGEMYGFQKIREIDLCDIAGPMFKKKDFKAAAKNVQCIHTSNDYGTNYYDGCHQNWRMGKCGIIQEGAKEAPYRSHGMCPILYNLAFEHEFLATGNVANCQLRRRDPASYPQRFRMGYRESRKEEVMGELFSPTSLFYPFTVDGELHSTSFDEYEMKLSQIFSNSSIKHSGAAGDNVDYQEMLIPVEFDELGDTEDEME